MKIQINLLSEEQNIKNNNGSYFRKFEISEEVKKSVSKKGLAQLVIHSGKSFEISHVVLNDQEVEFEKPQDSVMSWRWGIPLKIKFDQNLLNINGMNKINLTLNPFMAG
jgi:hypothetical protein